MRVEKPDARLLSDPLVRFGSIPRPCLPSDSIDQFQPLTLLVVIGLYDMRYAISIKGKLDVFCGV